MAKRVKLEMTQRQFEALTRLLDDNSTMIGGADPEWSIPTVKNIKLVQKAFDNSGIKYQLSIG